MLKIDLPGSSRVIAICIICAAIRTALICGQVFSLSAFIVGAWQGLFLGGIPSEAFVWLAIFVVCFAGRSVVSLARDRFMRNFSYSKVMDLREQLLIKVFETGGVLDSGIGSGAITSTLIDGVHAIERYIRIIIPKTIDLLLVPALIAVVIFTQDVISGIIVVVCYPCIIAFMRLIGYTAKDESAKRHDAFVRMSGHFLDSMRGMSTLKAFGIAKKYSKLVFEASENYRHTIMKTLRIATLSGTVLDIFATCGLAAVAIMLGFRMVDGDVLLFPALVVLMLVPEYFAAVRAYASDYHATLDGKTALEKARAMLASTCRRVRLCDSGTECDRGTVTLSRFETMERTPFHIALVGPSGSGKSTILDILAGKVELIDGDSPKIDSKDIAYIPQSPHLISGTLRENVSLYNPQIADDEIMSALEAVGLGDVVASMEQGLDTRLVGSGDLRTADARTLSGGEAHRVSIARALLSERRIWLLDEPGSDLDEHTERQLFEAIAPLIEDKTAVIATHSGIWLEGANEIIDMTTMEVIESDAA